MKEPYLKEIARHNKELREKQKAILKKISTLSCENCQTNDNVFLLMESQCSQTFLCKECGSKIKVCNSDINSFSSQNGKEGNELPVLALPLNSGEIK